MARHAVTAHTVDVFTRAEGSALHFTEVTVLLVRMGVAQVRFWANLVGDPADGTAPVEGYEVRASDGALLGAILPLGHMARRMHVQWYGPVGEEFYPAGDTDDAVLTQGVARVLAQRPDCVGDVPLGRDLVLDPEPIAPRRNTACPFLHCFDAHCIDHGPVWADAGA
ncbi:hypothetical protein [Streptomyces sp. NPDC088847]|uniref:hypothetical protein n=1 Tax=Streptomyces sp. NPDC088847 TaxID=3365909 RepID=UPI0038273EE0